MGTSVSALKKFLQRTSNTENTHPNGKNGVKNINMNIVSRVWCLYSRSNCSHNNVF